jgi:hypothetical protein
VPLIQHGILTCDRPGRAIGSSQSFNICSQPSKPASICKTAARTQKPSDVQGIATRKCPKRVDIKHLAPDEDTEQQDTIIKQSARPLTLYKHAVNMCMRARILIFKHPRHCTFRPLTGLASPSRTHAHEPYRKSGVQGTPSNHYLSRPRNKLQRREGHGGKEGSGGTEEEDKQAGTRSEGVAGREEGKGYVFTCLFSWMFACL